MEHAGPIVLKEPLHIRELVPDPVASTSRRPVSRSPSVTTSNPPSPWGAAFTARTWRSSAVG